MYFYFQHVKVRVFKTYTFFRLIRSHVPIEQCLHPKGVHSVNTCLYKTIMFTTPGNALIIHVFM